MTLLDGHRLRLAVLAYRPVPHLINGGYAASPRVTPFAGVVDGRVAQFLAEVVLRTEHLSAYRLLRQVGSVRMIVLEFLQVEIFAFGDLVSL